MASRKRSKYVSKKPLVPARRAPTPRGVAKAEPVRPSVLPKRTSIAGPVPADPLKYVRSLVRDIPDFPQPGILFRDITPILADPRAFHITLDAVAERFIGEHVDAIVAVESRGFIFGGALAARLNASFVPVRKPGKLPATVDRVSYSLEYGKGELEMHRDALRASANVVVVDDLLATGGTAEATAKLAESLGGEIAGLGFVVELDFLNPRAKLKQYDVFSLLHYDK